MYYTENTLVFYDGDFVKAHKANTGLYSQSLHYGVGVFEGIRSYKTANGPAVFRLKEHFERFLYSADKMNIPIGYSTEEMEMFTYRLLELNKLENAYIRPLLFCGPEMSLNPSTISHLVIQAWPWEKLLGDKGVRVKVSSFQRPNPYSCFVEAKVTGHYVNSILATTEVKAAGYDEALLLDNKGFVAEGSGANFFMERDECLYTPETGNILPGITRKTIMEQCSELGILVKETKLLPADVLKADAAFFTGTAAEVVGIRSVNDHELPLDWEDSLGYLLARRYQKLVREEEEAFALV